ncbi:MAG: hypothetical protein LBO74_02110 [Candidatus Symbiothrix sp.]|jgi:hypothetical protein|nr:hypothetical protein [Candidatus Symbiothrix sp.]
MIKVPFRPDKAEFAREMKPKISGNNLNLEYQNIESSLYKVAAEIPDTISQTIYDRLVDAFIAGDPAEPDKTAIDYLRRAMLHFALYEHAIFLITHISNDGITVKKNDNETTAFKYQTDALDNKLITTAWFWINQLIKYLNEHIKDFPKWAESQQKQDSDNLPVDLSDFNKWVGVSLSGGEYFMIYIAWIIREVWLDCVCSRIVEPVKTDAIARAVCYEVMGRACSILAYSILPEPVRKDIDNEMGKNHREQADRDIKERISGKYLAKAETYWKAVDIEIKKNEIEENRKTATDQPIIGRPYFSENDKFCMT